MAIVEFVLISGDFMRESVETPNWKWRSFTKVTIPIPVHCNSSYDEFVENVMQNGDLYYAPSDVVISYLMHSREKVNPTIINSDVRVLMYIMDADADGFRSILRMESYKFDGDNVTLDGSLDADSSSTPANMPRD
ncbi:hypothetical protein BC332_23840 [Capsicum chinense]|nr:hypothetical protein BC332_23840 [Capsicum chinense]